MKNYKGIWNNLSTSLADASHVVGYHTDEEEIRQNGMVTASFLRQVLEIEPTDKVLEIGCGVARIGRELAPYCGEWHGTDISGNMIAYARERTHDVPNSYLHELPESDLSIFNDGYFDCVYSSIVFMHLDKLDVFGYMREAYRLLRPGGRAYFDTYNILAPEAWQEFLKIISTFTPVQRPGHVSQFSTPQEMQKFLEEAGFVDIHVDGNDPQLVLGLGRKPEQQDFDRPRDALNPNVVAKPPDNEILKVMDGNAILPYKEWLLINEHIVAKDAYIAELEANLTQKDYHITTLASRIRKHERMLEPLPVRVALRLSKRKAKSR